jgi:putative PIN family toxin of toxin-antitoxin system
VNKKATVVLDTNILISAVLFKGTPLKILKFCIIEEKIDVAISPELMAEFVGKLKYKFGLDAQTLEELKELIEQSTLNILPQYKTKICRDDSDNMILDLAIYSKAGYIVTGDKDLLELKNHKGIEIITAAEFLGKMTDL